MTTDNGWLLYPSQGKGGRTISGRYVTITGKGAMAISPDMTAELPPAKKFLRIELKRDARLLRLTPVAKAEDGALKVTMPGGSGKGHQARIGTQYGFRAMGIVPAAVTRYQAQWVGDSILVGLDAPFDGQEDSPQRHGGHGEEGKEKTRDAKKTAAMDAEIEHEDALPQETKPAAGPGDLIGIAEVCRIAGIAPRSVGYFRRVGKFPGPAGHRGLANLWRRGDIEAWLAARTGPAVEAGVELLDTRAVAAMIGCTQATLYARICEGSFPKHTQARGKKHLWQRPAVEAWLAARRTGKTAAASVAATPAGKTCGTCADCKTLRRMSMCRSDSSEHRNQAVQPTGTCESHRKPSAYRPVRVDDED